MQALENSNRNLAKCLDHRQPTQAILGQHTGAKSVGRGNFADSSTRRQVRSAGTSRLIVGPVELGRTLGERHQTTSCTTFRIPTFLRKFPSLVPNAALRLRRRQTAHCQHRRVLTGATGSTPSTVRCILGHHKTNCAEGACSDRSHMNTSSTAVSVDMVVGQSGMKLTSLWEVVVVVVDLLQALRRVNPPRSEPAPIFIRFSGMTKLTNLARCH